MPLESNMFSRIEQIRINEKLSVTDFIDLTGISRGTYYKLKNEEEMDVTDKIIYKLNSAFPKYPIDWIRGENKIISFESPDTIFLKEDGTKAKVEEITAYIRKQLNTFKEDPTFINIIDIESLKTILKAKDKDGNIDIDKIG